MILLWVQMQVQGAGMRAMVMKGGVLELQQLEKPKIKEDEVLIKIVASGVNRCDLMQPRGVGGGGWFTKPHCPGHECSGTITAIGTHVTQWKVGDKVCAILDKGGYAEQVAVPAKQLLPIPTNVSLADAASLPFAACNIWLALFANQEQEAPMKKVLIHEGASKIGSMAIQFAKYKGMKVIATAGNAIQLSLCEAFGADACFDHKTQDLVDTVMKETRNSGVDFILDYGASYLVQNLQCLNREGRILIVDLQGEAKSSVQLVHILGRNSELQVSDIRTQSMDQKASIIGQVQKLLWPVIEEGKVRPRVGVRLSLTAAGAAPKFLTNKTLAQNIILYP
ncbi:hypothetical protein BUALT_BualtUnG0014900 [Buddleja alternifolia]|uniref:Enoyl reductase (ER) domain-containing protein n=1 Tax=Buddleja alternifolia TaxID=168488 RepID=A0AAV6W5G5_9LAMI|nr:hypothetical protein BUALT_BualtUnG0014900 [Buddleja alternifolia]